MAEYINMQSGIQKGLNNTFPNQPQVNQQTQQNSKEKIITDFIKLNANKFPSLVNMINNPSKKEIAIELILSLVDPNNASALNTLRNNLFNQKGAFQAGSGSQQRF